MKRGTKQTMKRAASNLAFELHGNATSTSADHGYRDGRADALTVGLSLRF